MSLPLSPADETFLLEAIKRGDGLIVLGAGASFSSANARGEPISMSLPLAGIIAKRASLPYSNESLKDVLEAVRGDHLLSDVELIKLYKSEFKGCSASHELISLLNYTWKRLYTWNIDDTLENINAKKAQSVTFYNGMADKTVEIESPNYLQIIHLHGQITKPDRGFIMTDDEYLSAINGSWHFWYKQVAQDYLSSCVIFIGSSLDEPILAAEIDRAKRGNNSSAGRSFLVVPQSISDIKSRSYRSRGIVHIKSDLHQFCAWLAQNLPDGLMPKDVIAKQASYRDDVLNSLTKDDLDIAFAIRQIDRKKLTEDHLKLSDLARASKARQFLRGFPPTWDIAASDTPVELEAMRNLYAALDLSIKEMSRLFAVIGQAGSGKTTGIMSVLLKYISDHEGVALFELSYDIKSVQRAFRLIKKLHAGRAIVYIKDVIVFGDTFKDDIDALSGTNITVVTTARSSEWREHLERYLHNSAKTFTFERFVRKDYDPLIDRIIKYVPAPSFRHLSRKDQYEKLTKSKSQLLIALREVTESENFEDIITNEFENLPDDDTKYLFLIVGIATLARVGIVAGWAQEIYNAIAPKRAFEKALDALEGIVGKGESGRLVARHELYVRHVIEKVAPFHDIKSTISNMLRSFTKYNIPIVRSVFRQDAAIFKLLLNHRFIAENERRSGLPGLGRSIYEEFEVEFQLDGHYWLQYGLYLAGLGDLKDAITMLSRSIEAYSGNPFAIHALADIQLRMAKERDTYDILTRELMDKAIAVLREQEASRLTLSDQYPLLTLARGHLSVLIKHQQNEEAKRFATEYFGKLQQMEKVIPADAVTSLKEKVFRYVTLGEWHDGYRSRRDRRSNPPRR